MYNCYTVCVVTNVDSIFM